MLLTNPAPHSPQACAAGTCMPDEALWAVACQAAQGLAFLHSHGVMHLDVKPDNIYLSAAGLPQGGSGSSSGTPCCAGCSGGTWRIGDFGLAVARGQDGSMVRRHGRVARMGRLQCFGLPLIPLHHTRSSLVHSS